MNQENINEIIFAIKKLKRDGVTLSDNLDTQKIMCDFESLQQRKFQNKFTLPSNYRFVKSIYQSMLESLAMVNDTQVKLFAPLACSIEKIKSALSHEYERKKIIDNRVMQLRKIMLFDSIVNESDTEDSDNESGPLTKSGTVVVAKQNPWQD